MPGTPTILSLWEKVVVVRVSHESFSVYALVTGGSDKQSLIVPKRWHSCTQSRVIPIGASACFMLLDTLRYDGAT